MKIIKFFDYSKLFDAVHELDAVGLRNYQIDTFICEKKRPEGRSLEFSVLGSQSEDRTAR